MYTFGYCWATLFWSSKVNSHPLFPVLLVWHDDISSTATSNGFDKKVLTASAPNALVRAIAVVIYSDNSGYDVDMMKA